MVILHIEAPDEAGHAGSIEEKVKAIEQIDQEVISRFLSYRELRLLIMPDHPTPIEIQTHVPDLSPSCCVGKVSQATELPPSVSRSKKQALH